MQFRPAFAGYAKLPTIIFAKTKFFRYLASNFTHSKQWMAFKNLGKTIRKAAFQAFARALAQFESKIRPVIAYMFCDKDNIISAFFRASVKGIEKFVSPFGWEYAVKPCLIKRICHNYRHKYYFSTGNFDFCQPARPSVM